MLEILECDLALVCKYFSSKNIVSWII